MEQQKILFWIIYTIGCIASYPLLRWVRRNHIVDEKRNYSYYDVLIVFGTCLCSWIIFIAAIFLIFILDGERLFKNTKPPKWL